MAKYIVEFAFVVGQRQRASEEVSADGFRDRPPFLDFEIERGGSSIIVARYRQDDIRKITRED